MNTQMESLRVVVADDPATCRHYESFLKSRGHEVAALVHDSRELVRACLELRPDLVISEVNLPGGDGIGACAEVNRTTAVPFVIVSAAHDATLVARAGAQQVMAYLIKPVKPADLEVALNLAILSFENLQRIRGEADALRREMEERKTLERAKGLIMKHGRMSDAEATRRLEALAAAKGLSPLGLAQDLIATSEAFTPPEPAAEPHLSGFSRRPVMSRPVMRPGR